MDDTRERYRALRRAVIVASTAVVALILAGVVPPLGSAEAKGQCKPRSPKQKAKAKPSPPRGKRARKPDRHGLSGKLNLNKANSIELQRLPGVGPRLARRIIAWRVRRTFKHIWDLRRVRGFGRKTLRRLSPYLATKGPTTLKRVK